MDSSATYVLFKSCSEARTTEKGTAELMMVVAIELETQRCAAFLASSANSGM